MSTFFIDESGYTGYDLLNKQQPYQGASSIQIDELSAEALIKDFFPRIKAKELKHRNLSRRKNNWDSLLEIQKVMLSEHMGITYICNKKYLLTLMFLDSCLEPCLYERGIDFFNDGQNYSLASLIYYTASTFWGSDNYKDLLYLFQRAVKTKSEVSILALIEKAKSLSGRDLHEVLTPLIMENTACIEEIKNPNTNTDAALVVVLSLISFIEKHYDSEYEIIHDTSNNLCHYNALLKWFIEMDTEKKFHLTEITTLKFPLKLKCVSQTDSHQSKGVQLADILIGGIIEHAMASAGLVEKNDYNQAVKELYGDNNIIHLLPSVDFKKDKQFRGGTQAQDFIEFMAESMNLKDHK